MKNLPINNFNFNWGARTYVMGILNLTPDSFSGDGWMDLNREVAFLQAREFIGAGIDVLDVVGESTRPGADSVSVDITQGADIIRVHDVPQMIRIARMADAIVR
jgi:dihydropteroate synthase